MNPLTSGVSRTSESHTPSVSLVVPAFNAEATIGDCVDSVLEPEPLRLSPARGWQGLLGIASSLVTPFRGPERSEALCDAVFNSGKKLGKASGSVRFGTSTCDSVRANRSSRG
jgi:hypothetical protein